MDPELVAGDPTTSAPAATVTASPLPDQGGNRKGGHQRFVTATSPSSSQRSSPQRQHPHQEQGEEEGEGEEDGEQLEDRLDDRTYDVDARLEQARKELKYLTGAIEKGQAEAKAAKKKLMKEERRTTLEEEMETWYESRSTDQILLGGGEKTTSVRSATSSWSRGGGGGGQGSRSNLMGSAASCFRASSSDPFGFSAHSHHGNSSLSQSIANKKKEKGGGLPSPIVDEGEDSDGTKDSLLRRLTEPQQKEQHQKHSSPSSSLYKLSSSLADVKVSTSSTSTPQRHGVARRAAGRAAASSSSTLMQQHRHEESPSAASSSFILPPRLFATTTSAAAASSSPQRPSSQQQQYKKRGEKGDNNNEEEEEEEEVHHHHRHHHHSHHHHHHRHGHKSTCHSPSKGLLREQLLESASSERDILHKSQSQSAAVLTQRVQQQQLEIQRLHEENEASKRQMEQYASWQARHRGEVSRLRKEEIEGRQREAVLVAEKTRAENQYMEARNDLDRLMTEQASILVQMEALKEETELTSEQLRETRHRAEEAEAKLLQTLEDQRLLVKRERKKEKEAQLHRLRAFEAQLETALEKFAAARQEIEQLNVVAEEQRTELEVTQRQLKITTQELERKRDTIKRLEESHQDVTEKYALVVQQQTEELSILRRRAQDGEASRERALELEDTVRELEHELDKRQLMESQCESLLKVLEEQQSMLFRHKDKEQMLKESLQKCAVREADWRSRAKMWAKEKAALEKETRELKFQLRKALS